MCLVGLGIDVIRCGGYNQGMTAKPERQSRQTYRKPLDAVHEAIEYGIDIAAIRDNLALSPAERLRRHDAALNLVEVFRKAKRV